MATAQEARDTTLRCVDASTNLGAMSSWDASGVEIESSRESETVKDGWAGSISRTVCGRCSVSASA